MTKQAWLPVALLTLLAALLRFPTLDAKSFWEDEAITVFLMRGDFGSMLSALPDSESAPPAYYVLAWPWTQLFGDGEVGIRSLSALIGTATVPVAFLAGREIATYRAGLVAAALVAVNPLLVWYSQEARAYALLVLAGSLSVLTFVRALRVPSTRRLLWWALAASLALATHYFALFLVLPEAAWLLARVRPWRRVAPAMALVGAVCAALLPLALHQREHPRWIQDIDLGTRTIEIPGIFLIGFESPASFVLAAAAAVLVVVAGWLLVRRSSPTEQRAALLVGGLGACAVLLPLVLAVSGVDYLIYKNVIVAVVPLALAVSIGFAASRGGRLGPAAAIGLCILSIAVVLATSWEPKYHREDWRNVAAALGEPSGSRALVVTPEAGREPLVLYLDARVATEGRVSVSEIDLVLGARRGLGSRSAPQTPRPPDPEPPVPGFELVERVEGQKFTLLRFEADAPVTVDTRTLIAAGIDSLEPIVLVQPATAAR